MVRSLIVLALVTSAGLAADDKKDDKKSDDYAKLIVGKWEITKAGGGAPAGTTIDFAKDKKVVMVLKVENDKVTVNGTYAVEKDKLTVKFKAGEKTVEETLTIKKLTAEAMELEDEKGGIDVLKKIK
jgi:uncharacterized protein (TIGR03066 family)